MANEQVLFGKSQPAHVLQTIRLLKSHAWLKPNASTISGHLGPDIGVGDRGLFGPILRPVSNRWVSCLAEKDHIKTLLSGASGCQTLRIRVPVQHGDAPGMCDRGASVSHRALITPPEQGSNGRPGQQCGQL
jgi:hypothetical protein